LRVAPRGALVLRLSADTPTTLAVRVGTHDLKVALPASGWHETLLELPPEVAAGRQPIRIQSHATSFTSLHYFSLARRD
jgi:hypothetical protein